MAYGSNFIEKALQELVKVFKGGNTMADEVVTSSTGTNFVNLADHACNSVTFVNDSGVDIKIKIKSSTKYITLFNGSYFTIDGINNSENLSVKRKDDSGTQVYIQYIYNY